MTIRALVMDPNAAMLLHGSVDPSGGWFESFAIADPSNRIRSTVVGDTAVILSRDAAPSGRLLVIDLKDSNFFLKFPDESRAEILRRILVGAQSFLTTAVKIPFSWRPFNLDSRISFHALTPASGKNLGRYASRIEIDRDAFGTQHIYVFNCSTEWSDLKTSSANRAVFDRAIAAYASARANGAVTYEPVAGGITLSDESYFHSENTLGFEEWIESRLTPQQREFVHADEGSSIRLRGAAGTGKTLALAIRALVLMKKAATTSTARRILFLTHSASTASATEALVASLDRQGVRAKFEEIPGAEFRICTMLDLALDAIGGDLEESGILPIATDALEGRRLQMELVEGELREFVGTADWRVARASCSEVFRKYLDFVGVEGGVRRVAWEFMNEFACVLDADGIRQKPELRQRYLKEVREAWMLPLPQESDRRIMLRLYDGFGRLIAEMNAISVDQLISDFLN